MTTRTKQANADKGATVLAQLGTFVRAWNANEETHERNKDLTTGARTGARKHGMKLTWLYAGVAKRFGTDAEGARTLIDALCEAQNFERKAASLYLPANERKNTPSAKKIDPQLSAFEALALKIKIS